MLIVIRYTNTINCLIIAFLIVYIISGVVFSVATSHRDFIIQTVKVASAVMSGRVTQVCYVEPEHVVLGSRVFTEVRMYLIVDLLFLHSHCLQ